MTVRERVYELLQPPAKGASVWSRAVGGLIIGLIVVSVVALALETVDSVYAASPRLFWWIEAVCVGAFTVEYVLRLWTCTADGRFRGAVRGRVRCAGRPLMVIDLLAILPFYLPMLGIDLRGLRLLRAVRLLRVAKLARYTDALSSIGRAVVSRRGELGVTLGFLLVLLFISASLLYYAEREAQPEYFGSIPEAMWWSIVTLTTIGYGDVVPLTVAGRIAGGAVAVIGIGFVALPTGILGSAFVEEIARRRGRGACPTCGRGGEGDG